MKMMKMMKIDDSVHQRLTEYAKKGETYSQAINRLLDEAAGASPKQVLVPAQSQPQAPDIARNAPAVVSETAPREPPLQSDADLVEEWIKMLINGRVDKTKTAALLKEAQHLSDAQREKIFDAYVNHPRSKYL